jgi:hypothetical protein
MATSAITLLGAPVFTADQQPIRALDCSELKFMNLWFNIMMFLRVRFLLHNKNVKTRVKNTKENSITFNGMDIQLLCSHFIT